MLPWQLVVLNKDSATPPVAHQCEMCLSAWMAGGPACRLGASSGPGARTALTDAWLGGPVDAGRAAFSVFLEGWFCLFLGGTDRTTVHMSEDLQWGSEAGKGSG